MIEYIQNIVEDFDFSSVKQDNSAAENVTKYLRLYDLSVDLGLPSGTRWFKYNLGVFTNELDRAAGWYGNFYAWGETKPNKREGYDWETYTLGKAGGNMFKYNNVDKLTQLEAIDDACKKIDSHCSIPTNELFNELLIYTDSMWIDNFDPTKTKHEYNDNGIRGLHGRLFTSVKNDKSIFIPAAGYCRESFKSPIHIGSFCHLWSSDVRTSMFSRAYNLWFSHNGIDVGDNDRYFGANIRPVLNK